jgi:hypothetical protein
MQHPFKISFPKNICVLLTFSNHLLCWKWSSDKVVENIIFHKHNLSLACQRMNLILWNSCDFQLSSQGSHHDIYISHLNYTI